MLRRLIWNKTNCLMIVELGYVGIFFDDFKKQKYFLISSNFTVFTGKSNK